MSPRGRSPLVPALLTATTLLLTTWFLAPGTAHACSCRLEPLDQVYQDSTDVVIAEVVAVRRVTERPVLHELADYVATFRVTHVYKGDSVSEFELPFQSYYEEPDPRDPPEEIIVGGCHSKFVVDETYVILLNGSEPIETHWCSSRIHAPYRVDLEFLEELADRNE